MNSLRKERAMAQKDQEMWVGEGGGSGMEQQAQRGEGVRELPG